MSEFIKYLKDNQHSPNCTRAQAFAMGQRSKQISIDHIREYLITGIQCAQENSEYWIALRDCLNELDGILSKE